ncbi:MAG: hypothetical protein JNJ56_01740 [Ignavibacteria bacterium]|nr:hypothetical protein [Ignavibacteria bacterium]
MNEIQETKNTDSNEEKEISDSSDEITKKENSGSTETDSDENSQESRFQEYFSENVESENPKMTETLKVFLQLKNIDEELFEIEEEKGDLPDTIKNIKSGIENSERELSGIKEKQKNLLNERAGLAEENSSFEEKINKYDEQKYNVRSNSEYDEIVKTIESLFEEVKKKEARIKAIDNESQNFASDIETLEKKLEELNSDLGEKQTLLDELDEQFKQEETVLREKRNELTSRLSSDNISLYDRINKMHKGEATAIVRRSNCSGCFNSIPPQRVIEIRVAEKIYTCQSCGRILISEELTAN